MIDPEDDYSGDLDCRYKDMGAAVIAHCNAPPVFEFSEHVFDLVALLI